MVAPSVASRVVRWQRVHGRNSLPWQNTRDPYRVWLSEVMLQQTQVVTAAAYFLRFVARLPTVASLAAASQDEVLGLWSGLGYYSRARNLHRCASTIMREHAGVFPQTAAALEQLPGIGRSTAAAISALCFGERVAILDANVRRVVARLWAFDGDLAVATNVQELWHLATDLLPRRNAARHMPRYTQGMMDLGATLCLARQPACPVCPVAASCQARALGTPELFPVKTRRLNRSAESVWLLWATDATGRVWLQRRPSTGVWGGLYCLPWFESRDALLATVSARARRSTHELEPVRHFLTHKDLCLHPVQLRMPTGSHVTADGRWVTRTEWPNLGLPAPVRTLLLQA